MLKHPYLKKIVLITSVLFLTSSLIVAEDSNPPDFAGGPDSGVVFWEFDSDTDQPTSYNYIPVLSSPVFGFRYYSGAWQWQSGCGISGDGCMLLQDEESIVQPIPSGTGSNLTVQLQLTWKGTVPGPGMDIEIWEGGESWTGGTEFPDGHLAGAGEPAPIQEIPLSDGWTHSTYEATFSSSGVTYVHIILHMDVEGDLFIDEAVVDMVVHDGPAPPSGPGRSGSGGTFGVQLLGDPNWIAGTTHTVEDGNDRGLIFTAHADDDDGSLDLASVTYGGQSMTKVIEQEVGNTTRNYVVAYFLDEAGITAAVGNTFSVSWGGNSPDSAGYSSAFFSSVDQTNPLGYALSNSLPTGADYDISTSPELPTNYGDMVIVAGTCGSPGGYTLLNDFVESLEDELGVSGADGVVGYKNATGSGETPSTEHTTTIRKVIIGFVLQTEGGSAPDTSPPSPATATWQAAPQAISFNKISMIATEASDASDVEYYFDETSGNTGGTDSEWQSSNSYEDTGLSPETQYTYQVKTRDLSPYQNEGTPSSSASATTAYVEFNNCPDGDLDDNCVVDELDLNIFAGQWLDPPDCPNGLVICADLDQQNDGINFDDYTYLAYYWKKEGAKIVINEVMASNDESYADPQGQYDDWIEIFNLTNSTLDISDLYLEDGDNNRWDFPSSTTIGAYDYLIVWADNDTTDTPGLHASFQLSAGSDAVYLYDVNDNLLDSVIFEDQLTDHSWGRFPDANEGWYTMGPDNTTPDAANQIPSTGEVYFSRSSGTFSELFTLELTTESPSASIYYTTDQSEPTVSDTLYTVPIDINDSSWVRARAYEPGFAASPISSRTYIKVENSLSTFNSNIPIVIVDSFGYDLDNDNRDYHPASMVIIDTNSAGTAGILDPAQFADLCGMHMRGNSSTGFDKKQYKFETWDENRPDPCEPRALYQDKNVSLLGLPSESDWVLQGPWGDKSHMKNYQMFAWSREIGNWSPRCIFVEAFIDRDGDGVVELTSDPDTSDYRGIYLLMEKIKRDNERVNIARLEDTGINDSGYLFSKNWSDSGENFETTTYGDSIFFEDPKADELSTAQKTWIENHFNDFESALASSNYDNPIHSDYYGNYIDIDSFVNYHILIETCKDVDGYVLSTFLYKDNGGKITMGPLWDLNGSMGASYFCSYDYEGWLYNFDEEFCIDRSGCGHHGECEEDWPTTECAFFPEDNGQAYEWYLRLFTDSEFLLKYADNWFHFREVQFDTTKMLNDLDINANVLMNYGAPSSPVDRNFTLWDWVLDGDIWPDLWALCHSGNVYYDYVTWLKTWLTGRLAWMDIEIDSAYGDYPPVIKVNGTTYDTGGHITSSDSISMIGGGDIYYTTDGTDPRLHAGAISGSASLYSSPFTLSKSTQIKARIRYSVSNWSAVNEATFVVGDVANSLRITEVMYHPKEYEPSNPDDPNSEFIELKNISGSSINLNLVTFTDGIDYTFGDVTLSAGSYIVLAKDTAVFDTKYPTFVGTRVGPYTGRINNAGERITLEDALDTVIMDFNFKDGWYHITDGEDFSLNIVNPADSDPNNGEYSED
ncbi:MAG: CotH kinase family protein, partial [Planctomycetota bacterium]